MNEKEHKERLNKVIEGVVNEKSKSERRNFLLPFLIYNFFIILFAYNFWSIWYVKYFALFMMLMTFLRLYLIFAPYKTNSWYSNFLSFLYKKTQKKNDNF